MEEEEEEEEKKEEKKEEKVRRKAGMGKDSVETDVDRPDPNMPEADTGGTANEAADARSEELRTVVDHLAEPCMGMTKTLSSGESICSPPASALWSRRCGTARSFAGPY